MRSASSGGLRRPVRRPPRLTEGVAAGPAVGDVAARARPLTRAT